MSQILRFVLQPDSVTVTPCGQAGCSVRSMWLENRLSLRRL